MQSTSKEQEAQHDFEQDRLKINLFNHVFGLIQNGMIELTNEHDQQGREQCDGHQANSSRQFQETGIDITEDGGNYRECCDDYEDIHGFMLA